ncbi:7-deoxyloganetin glucosyltransferase-like protein [Tanacetum coccineum]
MVKQLKEIHNFKQEGDETLYQAWERYNDLLYKFPTHDLNNHQKVNILYKGLDTMTRQLLDLQGLIPNKTLAQVLTAIQTMANHSQKWHDGSTSRRVSNDSSDGITTITNKLDSLGRDMKKLKENVHAIQVGCENYGGAHLNKECPLHEEVKSVKEVKYGEFGRPFPNNNGNGARYHVGPPGYYTRVDNRPPFAPTDEASSKGTTELQGVSFISDDNVQVPKEMEERPQGVLPCQLPLKELNLRSFTLPCTIGSLNFYAMADLGASVNIMPRSMFNHLKLTNLKKTDMLVEMADMTKKAPS